MWIKNTTKTIFPLIFLIHLISCEKNYNPLNTDVIESYEIYFLEDEYNSYSDVEKLDLQKLKLQDNPQVRAENMDSVTIRYMEDNPYKSYYIIFKQPVNELLGDEIRPFVLVVNGVRYCLGEYWPRMMAYVPRNVQLISIRERKCWLIASDEIINSRLSDLMIFNFLEKAGVVIEYKNIGR